MSEPLRRAGLRGVHRRSRPRLGSQPRVLSTLSTPLPPLPLPLPRDAEKFYIETYGIGRNPHGSKYIPMGFLSDLIRSYPVTYLSILSRFNMIPSPEAWHASFDCDRDARVSSQKKLQPIAVRVEAEKIEKNYTLNA